LSKIKFSFTFLLTLFLVGLFVSAASAESGSRPSPTPTQTTPDVTNANGVQNDEMNSPEWGKDIRNANESGIGTEGSDKNTDILKSGGMTNQDGTTGSQRTHGEYHNNTNSCASCHQTHTADSKSLLFKDGVYATCSACHDGTLGFYNVFENGNHKASAGTFGGTTEGNMSVHNATGVVAMAAAPGGTTNLDKGGKWTSEFNCASCHAPHGSYSDRLLHYSPNGMASTPASGGGIKAGGYKAPVDGVSDKNGDPAPVVDYSGAAVGSIVVNNTVTTAKFIGVKGTAAQHGVTDVPEGYVVVMVYQKGSAVDANTTTYTKTTNPFLYGYPERGSGTNSHYYYARLFTKDPTTAGFLNANGTYPTANAKDVVDHYDYLAYDTESDSTKKAYIKYAKGMFYGPADGPVSKATHIEVSRNYVVKLDLMPINALADGSDDSNKDGWKDFGGVKITTVNQRALYAGEISTHSVNATKNGTSAGATGVKGWGIAVSDYCSTCHTDYLASTSNQTATAGEGVFTKAYRHTTKSDTYTCVRCHFAHGTDVEIMLDAQNRNVDHVAAMPGMDATKAAAYMLDKNPSSALKRYTNMAVCWSCHTSSKAESLKNTDSYSYDKTGVLDPRGIPTTEGKVNHPVGPTTYVLPVPAAPSVTADDTNNTITDIDTTMEYSLDGTTYTTYDPANAPDLTGDKTVQVRVKAVTGVNQAGAVTTLNFTTNL
jgi:predicted CXXCH cytochrome family protein